jgi:hypothetical protein
MIESAFQLFSATRDPRYVQFGRDALWALQNNSRTTCGYASIADVQTGRLDNRMDSYFFAETLKYMYLLFDEALIDEDRESIFCNRSPEATEGRKVNVEVGEERAVEFVPRCVAKQLSVFSTEGHLFLLNFHQADDSGGGGGERGRRKAAGSPSNHPTPRTSPNVAVTAICPAVPQRA